MESLSPLKRAALSELIRKARLAKRWSQERLADRAEAALRHEAACLVAQATRHDAADDASLYVAVEVTRHHVATLENCPARPLSDAARRARLLGIVVALELDRARVNQLAGGI